MPMDMMENLTEQISAEIGPKWVLLLSRLQLDYKESSRERFRLCVQYKDCPKHEQEIKCARDTIRLWQKGVGESSEREVMTQLLTALRRVKGFEERAKELAESYGITLVDPLPVTTATTSLPTAAAPTPAAPTPASHTTSFPSSDGTSVATVCTDSYSHHTVTTSTTLKSSSPTLRIKVPPNRLANSTSEEPWSDVDSPSTHTQPTAQEHKQPRPSNGDPTVTVTAGQSEDHSHIPVNISVTKHKYAILDICQRLPAGILPHLAQTLKIPQEKVREISAGFPMAEERYYQILKHWLCASDRQRTFVELRGALESCQQQTVSDFIVRRLQSSGLTLRSPAAL